MATIVDATCSITEASCQPEKEDGTVSLATSSKRKETLSPNQNLPTNTDSWNGSLPVAVPTNPAGPGFHYVESSTTDSGVSNPSSVTSDGIPITQCTAGEPSTELQLELRTVERALRSSGIEDVGECERGACVSAHPGTGLGGEEGRRREEGGETEYGELSGGPTQGECVHRVAVCNGVWLQVYTAAECMIEINDVALSTPTLTEKGSNVHNYLTVCCVWAEL